MGSKLKLRKIGQKTYFIAGMVDQKIYVGVKILSNAKAEILPKNS